MIAQRDESNVRTPAFVVVKSEDDRAINFDEDSRGDRQGRECVALCRVSPMPESNSNPNNQIPQVASLMPICHSHHNRYDNATRWTFMYVKRQESSGSRKYFRVGMINDVMSTTLR